MAVKVSNISRATGKKHQNESVVTSQIAKSMLNVTVWPLRIIRLNIKCGVPQGSIMGPLLFNINDIHLSSSLLKFILFADDINDFFSNAENF